MGYPIENLVEKALTKIREMSDVETIIGEPIKGTGDVTIIPVSKVSVGFAAGGSDIPTAKTSKDIFGGGSGAGLTISPVAFIVINKDGNVELLQISQGDGGGKLLGQLPELITKVKDMFAKKKDEEVETEDGIDITIEK